MTKTAMAGKYVVRFNGFARADKGYAGRSYNLVGLGTIELTSTPKTDPETGTIKGGHRSTLNPMTGLTDQGDQRDPATYVYQNATYMVKDAGPPIQAELTITFTEQGGKGRQMSDTFLALQCGVDQFWLISSNPQDNNGNMVDEVVVGEAVKVDPATW
jgi:hypothetical protein